MPRTFDAVPAQVDAMVRVWEARGGSRDDLTRDAFAALEGRGDLTVLSVPEFVPHDSQRGLFRRRWVSMGSADADRDAVDVMAAPAIHAATRTRPPHPEDRHRLGTAIVEHREPEAFEDASCDAFAARMLLPDDLVEAHIHGSGPTVSTATGLFAASNASRAAICVRLVGRLRSAGVVAVLDGDGIVTFAAACGGLFPPARGSDQCANLLVQAAMRADRDGRVVTRDDAKIWYAVATPPTCSTAKRLGQEIGCS